MSKKQRLRDEHNSVADARKIIAYLKEVDPEQPPMGGVLKEIKIGLLRSIDVVAEVNPKVASQALALALRCKTGGLTDERLALKLAELRPGR